MRTAGLLALVLLVGVAGCGGDDGEEPAATRTATGTEATGTEAVQTATTPSEPEPRIRPTETQTTPRVSPEDLEGGAGDEEPARVLALFTGRGGRITPPVIRVPPFISVRVELRSADGEEYGLSFAGETIQVSEGLGSVAIAIDGLRPGESIVGKPAGAGTRVRIEATAEPGP